MTPGASRRRSLHLFPARSRARPDGTLHPSAFADPVVPELQRLPIIACGAVKQDSFLLGRLGISARTRRLGHRPSI